MRRSTDEIRYCLLKVCSKHKSNIEAIREEINTGLPSILANAKSLEKMGFLRIYEIKIGKRFYREIEITPDGRYYLSKLKKIFK